jgi:hypothetical protein
MTKRPAGRPPLDATDPSVPVTVSLPSQELKVYADDAKGERLTVQDWIRRCLRDAHREITRKR